MKTILFVCLGNICRSPMAEAIFNTRVKEANLADLYWAQSAATSQWEVGKPPHQGTQEILQALAISTQGMTAQQITQADFHKYDLIIGMDQSNVADLRAIAPKEEQCKIRLFMEFASEDAQKDVPDPYYTGDFQETEEMVEKGVAGWIRYLQERPLTN